MPSVDDLVRALPIRDIRVRYGSQTSCGGMARALVDFEPGSTPGLDVVDAVTELPAWAADFREEVDFCVEHIGTGIRAELEESFGADIPAIRVLVREVFPHPVDANESVNRAAGRLAVREALRTAGR